MLCADGEVVWSWHTKAGVKLAMMLCIAPMTVAKKPGHRGEREGNRKTIARGMPVIRLHLWRLRSCAFSKSHAGPWVLAEAPGIPCALFSLREVCQQNSDAIAPRERALVSGARERKVGKGINAVPTMIVVTTEGDLQEKLQASA